MEKRRESREMKNRKFVEVCHVCYDKFEIPEEKMHFFAGKHHPNCEEEGPHYHSPYSIPVCEICRVKHNITIE